MDTTTLFSPFIAHLCACLVFTFTCEQSSGQRRTEKYGRRWDTANSLRAYGGRKASDYAVPVLGLIFFSVLPTTNTATLNRSWLCAELLKWKQLQPVEPELYFYRTAAGLEVDFLLASEHGIIPIEAKSSGRVTTADGRSVETFMAEHPDAAKVGLVVYPGDEVVELRRNVWGVPDWYLLGAL